MRQASVGSIPFLLQYWILFLKITEKQSFSFVPAFRSTRERSTSLTLATTSSPGPDPPTKRSLADSFLIDIQQSKWKIHPLDHVVDEMELSEGQRAVLSLQQQTALTEPPCASLTCHLSDDGNLRVTLESSAENLDENFLEILSCVLAQHSTQQLGWSPSVVTLLPGSENHPTRIDNIKGMRNEEDVMCLFEHILQGKTSNVEMVEMVDQSGVPLGMLPRKLVHKWNILHRGSGMVIAKDGAILTPGKADCPDLYVHRRTDTKRIFPSLYDMFVGGVSAAKEPPEETAAREIAEELGLSRALMDPNALSPPLFDCTVCTSYNRCVVTVFCYSFDSKRDVVSWQEEEVAWGSFMPYEQIRVSANMSIKRLVESSNWPGKVNDRVLAIHETEKEKAWMEWDYVPDGLLVWEAWLEWQEGQQKEEANAA